MEVLLPSSSLIFLTAGLQLLNLTTWTQETTLMTVRNYLKIYSINLIPFAFSYVALSVLWSVYLQNNHPLPLLFTICYFPTIIIAVIGLWFILPPQLLTRPDFRQKLKIYTFYWFWDIIPIIMKEILSSLFINPPGGLQFLVPFVVVGCRELDKRIQSNLVKKMMGELDEAATVLLAIVIGTNYSFFIAIRLVGADLATICSTVTIDFALHLRMTFKIIQEFKRINNETLANTGNNTKIIISHNCRVD